MLFLLSLSAFSYLLTSLPTYLSHHRHHLTTSHMHIHLVYQSAAGGQWGQ